MDFLPAATAADEQQRQANVAVLPVGAFEQHGAHLPLATDAAIAHIVGQRLAEQYGLLLLPTMPIGASHEHEGLLAGTVSIRSTTLASVVTDVAESLERAGVHRLVVVNGHGGNYVLSNVVQEASVHSSRRMLLYPDREAWAAARSQAGCVLSSHDDMHAGEAETSILLHAAPHLVRAGWETADHRADERPNLLTTGMSAYTTTGVIGRPSAASATKGEAIIASFVATFSHRLNVLCSALAVDSRS